MEWDEMDLDEELEALDGEDMEEEVQDSKSRISDELRTALLKSPQDRTWQEVEMVDRYRNPDYEAQVGFRCDSDTGEALRDEEGNFVRSPRNVKGTQVPDLVRFDDDGSVHIIENKLRMDLDALMDDMASQSIKRKEAFGEDVDLLFSVVPPRDFTVGDADRLQRRGDYLGVDVEFQMK